MKEKPSATSSATTTAISAVASPSGVSLSDSDLRKLSAALGVQIRSTADLLREVESMSKISVDGFEVKLMPEVLRRFMSRNIASSSPEKYVQEKVSELIGEWCGW